MLLENNNMPDGAQS